MATRRALGRGLEALIPRGSPGRGEIYRAIPVSQIMVPPWQPRSQFREEELRRLAESIKQNGVLQPLIVRPVPGGYELVAGERRLRAARMAGQENVPALVREVRDQEAVQIALVENLQREDLGPMEEARALERLCKQFGMSHQEVACRIGKDRSTVSNALRLLTLPSEVREQIQAGGLTAGHARALLALDSGVEQVELARRVVKDGLSVRQAEALAARRRGRTTRAGRRRTGACGEVGSLEDELGRVLGTRVRVLGGRRRGRIVIEYYGHEDLTRLVDLIKGGGVEARVVEA